MRINSLPYIDRRARVALICGLLLCGLAFSAPIGDARAHAARTASGHALRAKASKVEIVNETLDFEITQTKGNVIYAKGKSLGTIAGSASLHLTLVNASHAVAELYASNSRGSVKGIGHARYHASGAISYFTGKEAPVLSGTGKYHGLRALSIKMTGVMNRRTLKISVQLKGKWDV